MSALQGQTLQEYLFGANKSVAGNAISTGRTNASPLFNTAKSVIPSSIGRIAAYILAIIIVIFVILLFVHFFIKPIFQLRPGAPGIIPVPGFDDGKLFWNKVSAGRIENKDLPISTQSFGYSLNLDVFIQNPLQFSRQPRIFFSRGSQAKAQPDGDTLLGLMDVYNLTAALLPDTNDLIVSVLNKNKNMESIIVPNIPIQEPFRLGIIVMEKSMEVYMNGHLIKTRTFNATPLDATGDIYPATGTEATITLVRNLKIWPRILTTSEIRYATPSLSTANNFGATPMPTSSTGSCGVTSTAERYAKLSADTVSDATSSLLSSI